MSGLAHWQMRRFDKIANCRLHPSLGKDLLQLHIGDQKPPMATEHVGMGGFDDFLLENRIGTEPNARMKMEDPIAKENLGTSCGSILSLESIATVPNPESNHPSLAGSIGE